MFTRKLPTLKFEAYSHAAGELCFLASDTAGQLLKIIGSNKHVSATTMAGLLNENTHARDVLEALCKRGYVISEEVLEDRGVCGIRYVDAFRVNWKQIRQLNKAVSLL